jgi:uncharacterized protein DUF5343
MVFRRQVAATVVIDVRSAAICRRGVYSLDHQAIERARETVAVPKAYLTSTKNVPAIFTAIQQAQAPKQFTVSFLNNLGFKSNADRLVVGMLKALGFLEPSGTPTQRYFEFLDQTQSGRILAESMRDAYADLFELNVNAQSMSRDEVRNKLKTLTQGQFSDDVLGKMASTFVALADQADFKAVEPAQPRDSGEDEEQPEERSDGQPLTTERARRTPTQGKLGLVYNIEIVLPESRDPAVYDALFRSLKAHLLND